MRNLKRVLSLALALVMVLGMMVVTTSAAAYADAEEITYKEAVDVMSAIGIINGDNGVFNPKGTLTREGAAKLICYLVMGADKADKLVGSGNFTDVAPNRWSAGSIDYCVSLGYIQGNGDGTFNPTGNMTVLGFGKLLLCALGYDAAIEGYTGTDWATNIATDMIEAGLEVPGVAFDAILTREIAAQMMLIALKTSTVYYNGGKGTNITLADGTKVVVGAGTLTKTAGAGYDYTDADQDGSPANTCQELVEKLYPTLVRTATANTTFMRPAYEWQYTKSGQPAVKVLVAAKADKVYTSAVKASQIYADLGLTAATVTPTVYVNGTSDQITSTGSALNLTKTGADSYGAPGVVTEVYKTAANAVTIVQIKYTLGYVNNVVSYAATAAKGAYTTYTIDNVSESNKVYVDSGSQAFTGVVFSSVVNEAADVSDVVLNGTFAKGDYVLYVKDVTPTVGTNYVYPVATVKGNLTASSASSYTIGGTAYPVANVTVADSTAAFDPALYSTTNPVTVVVDSYGNVIAPIQGTSSAAAYFYVVASEDAHSLVGTTLIASVTATVVGTDGEAKTISVSKIGNNAIDGNTYKASNVTAGLYTYKLAMNGATYELTAVTQPVYSAFNYKTSSQLASSIHGNDNTVFYTITTESVGGKTVLKSVTKTVGMAAMGDVTTATGSYVKNMQSIATIVFLTQADVAGVDKVVYYNGSYSYDGTKYTYSVNSNGVDTTLVGVTGLTNKGLYSIDGGTNVATAKNSASTFSAHTGLYTNSGHTFGLVYNGGLLSVVDTTVATGVATSTANIDTVGANVPVYTYTSATGACTVSTAAEMAVSGASLIYIAANAAGNAIGAIYVIV